MNWFAVRKGERRDAWAALATLLVLIASHSLLETARDALFLAKIPATRLPWMFLTIAVSSLGLVKLGNLLPTGLEPRRRLAALALVTAGVTAGLYALLPVLGAWGLYALYVWSGLITTFVLVHFWQLLSDRFTITQAKRLYGFIGSGSVLGAILGSGAASLLSRLLRTEQLLLVAAAGFGLAAFLPLAFAPRGHGALGDERPLGLREMFDYVAQQPYARRLIGALFLAACCLTVSDFVFKSLVAELVPKSELAGFLGISYFSINVLSLLCQLGLVGWILRRLSLGGALAVLPLLLTVAGLGVVVTGSLVAAVALRGADGALRYSLHRTTAELLVLPFGAEGRRRVKSFAELVAQRGGQIVAALAMLGLGALGTSPRAIAAGLVTLAAAWAVMALSLRAPYIDLFRTRLRAGRLRRSDDFPEIDVASLELLLGALESDNDREVLAALEVLERESKGALVPALLLHHPSERVVLAVLRILARSTRIAAVPVIDRITEHASPRVRAAAFAARSLLVPDPERLRRRLAAEDSEDVREVLVANLAASGALAADECAKCVVQLIDSGSLEGKRALVEAVTRRGATGFESALLRLAQEPDVELRRAAVEAMGTVPSEQHIPALIESLADQATRAEAENALAAHGAAAFEGLRARFEDKQTDATLRFRLPAAMARSQPLQALEVLTEGLAGEHDGVVRFGMLLTLEQLVRRHPTLRVPHAALLGGIGQTLGRAYRYLDAREALVRGLARHPERKTPGHELLHDLLRDKEINARDRLFRLLGLLHPGEDFTQIHQGLSAGKEQRAVSLELIESILSEPLRSAVLGLGDDGSNAARLLRSGSFHRPLGLGYEAMLGVLADADSRSIREVARHHQVELGLGAEQREHAA